MDTREPFDFFHSTRRIVYGAGSLGRLSEFAEAAGAKRAFVLMDAFFLDQPLADTVRTVLAGAAPMIHPVPRHEPTTPSVEAARAALIEVAPDLVVAIGGGSAIDTAKAARMHAANPGPFEALVSPKGVPMDPHPSLFVAVPTTAGTGSEVSDSAIVDVPGTTYKAVLRSPEMAPRIAILDPALGVTAPAGVTAASGFDALTHAIEAYTSKMANPMTDPFALSGATLLAENLARAVTVPDDVAARGACLIGSMQAGIAFNSAHLGLAHAIAGALGALHHVPHGLANALALPWTMAFNRPVLGDKGDRLAALFGTDDVATGLSALRREIGLDQGLDRHVGSDSERDAVAAAAMVSGQIRVNPRTPSEHEVRVIVEAMREPTGGSAPNLNL